MARPRKPRMVYQKPESDYFKPRAVPLKDLREVDITIDELEALRLSDLEQLSQAEAAARMDIHQSTFHRTLSRAREKLTDALVNGKAIKIHGGDYKMPDRDGTGPRGEGPRTGRGLGNCKGSDDLPRQQIGRCGRPRRGLGRGRRP